jgi:probable rRNA maturation factor
MTRKPHGARATSRAPGRRRSRVRRQSLAEARPKAEPPQAEPAGIEISNLQSHVRITAREVRAIVRAVLAAEEVRGATLSVVLADNETVHRVNREYLQHDYDTDVLSFLFGSTDVVARKTAPSGSTRRGRGRLIDGEVLASAEMAAQMAGRFGWSARDELTLYLVHGLLHLCGYDDLTPPERRIMRSRERAILVELGISLRRGRARRRASQSLPAKNGSRS